MEFSDVISARRTVRDFSSEAVSEQIIEKALNAGLKAPSYNHLKQWHFVLVHDKSIRLALTQTEDMPEKVPHDIEKELSRYEQAAKSMYMDAIPKQKSMIMDAPGLLVVVYKPKTSVPESTRVYDLNCLASAWCCIENILLSFAEDGVFGVTFIPKNTPGVRQVLAIPDDLEVAALIPFGYKRENAKIIAQKQIALKEAVHTDRW